nr:hypothetical protein [Janibacter limosus]
MSVDRTLRNASISGRLRDLHIVGDSWRTAVRRVQPRWISRARG